LSDGTNPGSDLRATFQALWQTLMASTAVRTRSPPFGLALMRSYNLSAAPGVIDAKVNVPNALPSFSGRTDTMFNMRS